MYEGLEGDLFISKARADLERFCGDHIRTVI